MSIFRTLYVLIGIVIGLGIAAAADGILIAIAAEKERKRKRQEEKKREEANQIMEHLLQDQARKGLKDRDGKAD